MAGPIKPKPAVKRPSPKAPSAAAGAAWKSRMVAANTASERSNRRGAPLPPRRGGGGIDLNKFAGEVGQNIGGVIGWAQNRVMGPSPIRNAMNHPDSQNPLKRRP